MQTEQNVVAYIKHSITRHQTVLAVFDIGYDAQRIR